LEPETKLLHQQKYRDMILIYKHNVSHMSMSVSLYATNNLHIWARIKSDLHG